MHVFIPLAVCSFLFCYILTPVCRNLFLRAGVVDHPDGERKSHPIPVPRIGGIAIALSYALTLAVALWFNPGGTIHIQHRELLKALVPAASVIFMTGLVDDLYGLKPRYKLLGQLLGSALAVGLGLRLPLLPSHPFVSEVLSVIWLAGCSNAINLIDGMDGLAAGVSLLATLTTLLVALLSGNVGLALATIPLAGCLLAFLRYNFSPASVFLGDCGSLSIGFVLGCFGLAWSRQTGTMLGMLGPLIALSLPLVDVALAIGRRFLRSAPIFKGDRAHIHHRIQDLGFSPRDTALLLYACCGIAAGFAVLESFSRVQVMLPIVLLFCVLVFLGIRRLRYIEFSAAVRAISRASMRRAVRDRIRMEEWSRDLEDAETVDEWWEVLRCACQNLGLASAHLELDAQTFFEEFASSSPNPPFRIHLGLGESGFLELTGTDGTLPSDPLLAFILQVQLSFTLAQLVATSAAPATVTAVASTRAA